MNSKDVIIPLDFKDRQTTLDFLKIFPDDLKPFVKIGMELFYSEGPDIVRIIRGMNHDVFLDLKLHDIPNTVKGAMRSIAHLDVKITNIHASTTDMMKAALEGLVEAEDKNRPLIVAVTQLTSTSSSALKEELLIEHSMEDTVGIYAKRAYEAGLDGVVCSPLEVETVRKYCGKPFITVTPGIRYIDSTVKDDQSRTTTPKDAARLGCDYIVVGRPITRADDPVAAYLKIKDEFIKE